MANENEKLEAKPESQGAGGDFSEVVEAPKEKKPSFMQKAGKKIEELKGKYSSYQIEQRKKNLENSKAKLEQLKKDREVQELKTEVAKQRYSNTQLAQEEKAYNQRAGPSGFAGMLQGMRGGGNQRRNQPERESTMHALVHGNQNERGSTMSNLIGGKSSPNRMLASAGTGRAKYGAEKSNMSKLLGGSSNSRLLSGGKFKSGGLLGMATSKSKKGPLSL
jgi:hypothetical protein